MGIQTQQPWTQFVGHRVRYYRESNGWTQEHLMNQVSTLWGLKWTRATVTAIESGKREVLAKEFLALLDAYGISASEFLMEREGDPDWLRTAPGASVSVQIAASAAHGSGHRSTAGRDNPWIRQATGETEDSRSVIKALDAVGYETSTEVVMRTLRASHGEAEKKAATSLGVDPVVVAAWAQKLWEKPLTEERDNRSPKDGQSERSLRTARGHITRALVADISRALDAPR